MLKYIHYTNIAGLIWTLCLCIINIPLPRWVLYGGLYIFFITWIVECVIEKRWKIRPSREVFVFGLLIVMFACAFIYWPWDGQHIYFQHHLEQRLPLLGFGVVGLFGLNNRYSRAAIINSMIIASVCSVIFLIFKSGWREALFSPNRIEIVSQCRIQYINAHMWYNFFLNSTLIGIWYLLFRAERKPQLWQKIIYPVAALIIFYALLCSDGRSGLFIGLTIVGLMIIVELYKFNSWLGLGFSVIAIASLITVGTLHPRMSKEALSDDLRYSYWKSAGELIAQKPVLGYGVSNAQEQFDQVNMKYVSPYDKYYWTVLHHHYVDCHNQYLQTMLEFGIIGLVLLLSVYLSPLVICWGKKEWGLAFFFSLISMWQSLFDVFLTGRFNMIYCILLLMMLTIQKDYSSSET